MRGKGKEEMNSGKTGKAADAEKTGKTGKAADAEKTGKTGKAADAEKAGKTGKAADAEKAGKTGKAADAEKTGETDKAADGEESSEGENFTCFQCADPFKEPLLLSCYEHGLCGDCLVTFGEDTLYYSSCPFCNAPPPPQTATIKPEEGGVFSLKTLCQVTLITMAKESNNSSPTQGKAMSETVCCLHGEKLHFFCRDDLCPVCVVCRISRPHKRHKISPISRLFTEADLEMELKISHEHFKQKMMCIMDTMNSYTRAMKEMKAQSTSTENAIKEEFECLHQFLRDEEEARIAVVTKEEERKKKAILKRVEDLDQERISVSAKIRAMEEEMGEIITYIQNSRKLKTRLQFAKQDADRLADAVINQSKHLETLQFLVWLKMKTVLEPMPMTMNPNTAHPELFLSDDLMTVKFIKDNPERFDHYHSVMANEGFDCGIHSWEVEVGNTSRWIVGVMAESAQRTGDFSAQKGRWFLWNNNGLYHARCTPLDPIEVKPEKFPSRIRVWLDFAAGEISFYDPENNVHLNTLKQPFYEKVFPYFNTLSALRIVPIKQPLWGQSLESEQD